MTDNRNTIAIGKDKDAYQIPLSLGQMSTLLAYFPTGSHRELKHIYGLIDLDSASRRKLDNVIKFKSDVNERQQLQIINKALTLELFTSSMFSYIDHPDEVHANCLVSHYPQDKNQSHVALPSNFAQGGAADTIIDYKDYMVILEVSAKRDPTSEDYRKQLSGALKHARKIREEGYKESIYCVLINERSLKLIENIHDLKSAQKSIKSSEDIFITSLSIEEFSMLGKAMSDTYEGYIRNISSDDLQEILQACSRGTNDRFQDLFVQRLDAKKSPLHGLGLSG